MNRRELLKAILPVASIPLLVKGQEVGKSFELESDAKYIVFLSADMCSREMVEDMAHHAPFPAGTPLYPIYVSSNETIDDAIRIFKVGGKV